MEKVVMVTRALRETQRMIGDETERNEKSKKKYGREDSISQLKLKKYYKEEDELRDELVRLKNKMVFIKNVIDVDVDGLNGVNHYTIKAMYNKIVTHENGTQYAVLEHKLIDEFDYTWDDIEKDGGIAQINKDLRECYHVEM